MKRLGWLIPAAALAAVLAAGCGGSSAPSKPSKPSTATLVAGMKTATQHATSVRMTGTVTHGTQRLHLDMSMTRSGEMAGQLAAGPASFTVLATGGRTYIKVTAGFLKYIKAPSGTCAIMCNKYLLASGSFKNGLTGSLNWPSLVEGTTKGASAGKLTNTGQVTVNGQPAWALKAPDGSTGYIAAHGTPYLLRLVAPRGETGRIDFSEWNHATIPPPPPASQVIDLSQLMGH